MGSIPVRSWSSALVILFGQNMCRILLRHLFWNTSRMWHIPFVTFQDSIAYSSTFSALLLKMRIFVFLLIVFVFQIFFRAANAPLALLILVMIQPLCFHLLSLWLPGMGTLSLLLCFVLRVWLGLLFDRDMHLQSIGILVILRISIWTRFWRLCLFSL